MAYIFKIKLKGSSKPPIWRKIEMNKSENFLDLHFAIQGAFGWYNCHMFQFSPKGYGSYPALVMKNEWMEEATLDTKYWPAHGSFYVEDIQLSQYFETIGNRLTYIYDFGDDWIHVIDLLESNDTTVLRPRCLAGKGTTPPEDCGGIYGYYHMVDVLSDPEYPEHQEWAEWMGMTPGEEWDLNNFDLDEANKRMR